MDKFAYMIGEKIVDLLRAVGADRFARYIGSDTLFWGYALIALIAFFVIAACLPSVPKKEKVEDEES